VARDNLAAMPRHTNTARRVSRSSLLRRALAEGSNFGLAFHQDHYLSSLTGFAPFEEFRNRER
jgi:hypothetical protein